MMNPYEFRDVMKTMYGFTDETADDVHVRYQQRRASRPPPSSRSKAQPEARPLSPIRPSEMGALKALLDAAAKAKAKVAADAEVASATHG